MRVVCEVCSSYHMEGGAVVNNDVAGTADTLPVIALLAACNTPKPTLRSLAILVATKIQQMKKKIALLIGDYFKIVSYLSEQFLMQFDWGWS